MNIKDRFKNPFFILGLFGIIFSAAGVNVETLTNWSLLWESILGILGNPFLLASVIAAVIGVFVDPSTKGLKDQK